MTLEQVKHYTHERTNDKAKIMVIRGEKTKILTSSAEGRIQWQSYEEAERRLKDWGYRADE